jgi:hypothetical protein
MSEHADVLAMARRRNLDFPHMTAFMRLDAGEYGDHRVLCEDCQFIIQYTGFQYIGFQYNPQQISPHHLWCQSHHLRQDGLQQGALNGCLVCCTLWQKLSVSQQNLLLSSEIIVEDNCAWTLMEIFPTSFSNSGDPETARVEIGFNFSMLSPYNPISRLGAWCVLHPANLEGN